MRQSATIARCIWVHLRRQHTKRIHESQNSDSGRVQFNEKDSLSDTCESSDNADNITFHRIVRLDKMFVDCWFALSIWIVTCVAILSQKVQWETTYRTLCWTNRWNGVFRSSSTCRMLTRWMLSILTDDEQTYFPALLERFLFHRSARWIISLYV